MPDVITCDRLNTVSKEIIRQDPRYAHYPQDDFSLLITERGEKIEHSTENAYIFSMYDGYNYAITPGGRNEEFPEGANKVTENKSKLYLKEFYGNAHLTYHDFEFQRGGAQSDIDIVAKALEHTFRGRDRWLDVCAIGDGTGKLCVLSNAGSAISSGNSGTLTATNTYLDLGWDNTVLLATGMLVDIYRYADSAWTKKATGQVLGVKTTRKRNAGNNQTGTFVFRNDGTDSYTPTTGDVVYWAGTFGKGVPMGLRGIVNPGIGTTASPFWGIDASQPFQGQFYVDDSGQDVAIARNSDEAYFYRSPVWRPNSSGQFAPITADNIGTYTGSALAEWDFGVLDEVLTEIEQTTTNENKVDVLVVSENMQQKMWTLAANKVEMRSTWISEMGGEFSKVFSTRQVTGYCRPDGEVIPVITKRLMPNNEILGLCSRDLMVMTHGTFDFCRYFGGEWQPTLDRKDNFEAPYRGFINFGSYRCDCHFVIQGLKGFNE